jgi:hypothetical protein
MSQQINLYHPGLRPAQRPLTAARLVLGVIVLGMVLAGYYAFVEFQVHQSGLALAEANSESKALQERILKIGGTAGQAGARSIEESIARAEAELKIREAVLKRLSGGDLGSTLGFSPYLTALARQRVEGVWITGLTVAGDSGDFTLQGGVSRPESLLEYIRKLSREDVLKGRQIGDFRMLRRELMVSERQATAAAPAGREPGAAAAQRWRFVEFSIGTGPLRGQPGS